MDTSSMFVCLPGMTPLNMSCLYHSGSSKYTGMNMNTNKMTVKKNGKYFGFVLLNN